MQGAAPNTRGQKGQHKNKEKKNKGGKVSNLIRRYDMAS